VIPRREEAAQRSCLFTRNAELGAEASEDYALRKVPYHWKRPPGSFAVTTDHLTAVLTAAGAFLFAWLGITLHTLVTARSELASGAWWIEHRRGYLRSWGAPAVTGLIAGSAPGVPLAVWDIPASYGGMRNWSARGSGPGAGRAAPK
jgi:hypothetical protein